MKSQIDISPVEWNTIETYLDQKSELDEASMLSEKLSRIPDLEEKIAHLKIVREEIEDSIRLSKIKEFHSQALGVEESTNEKIVAAYKSNSKIIWYSIAAAMVVLIGIFWMMNNTPTSEKIFASHFKPDIGLPLKMGTKNNYGFYEGMLDYKQGKYKNATDKWQVLWKNNPENDTLNYFLGVAHLAQGNATKSLEYLGNQGRFQQGIFEEDAAYYAALAKIKEEKFEEAKVLLKKNPSDRNIKLLNVLQEQ